MFLSMLNLLKRLFWEGFIKNLRQERQKDERLKKEIFIAQECKQCNQKVSRHCFCQSAKSEQVLISINQLGTDSERIFFEKAK